jgi:hypothetical protein
MVKYLAEYVRKQSELHIRTATGLITGGAASAENARTPHDRTALASLSATLEACISDHEVLRHDSF